jgi:hypothetical membrane protein
LLWKLPQFLVAVVAGVAVVAAGASVLVVLGLRDLEIGIYRAGTRQPHCFVSAQTPKRWKKN